MAKRTLASNIGSSELKQFELNYLYTVFIGVVIKIFTLLVADSSGHLEGSTSRQVDIIPSMCG